MPIGCAKAAMMSGAAGGDPFWPYVVFLFQPKSEHLSFLDLSASGHTISTTNSPTLSSTAPFPGHKSGLFVAASSQYAEMADSPDWDFSSHFTVEVLARQVSVSSNQNILGRQSLHWCNIWIGGTTKAASYFKGAAVNGGTTVGTGTWDHWVAERFGTTTKLWFNQNLAGANLEVTSTSDNTTYSGGGNPLHMCRNWVATGYGDSYIAAVRITNGAARYGGGTPPTPTEPFPAKG
jgi:hypothetical protein